MSADDLRRIAVRALRVNAVFRESKAKLDVRAARAAATDLAHFLGAEDVSWPRQISVAKR